MFANGVNFLSLNIIALILILYMIVMSIFFEYVNRDKLAKSTVLKINGCTSPAANRRRKWEM